MRRPWFLLALPAAIAGCAHSYDPVVDMKGVDQASYDRDLGECRAYADRVDVAGEAGTHALAGGAIGGVLGAIAGAVGGGAGSGAALGAGLGAVAGGAQGAVGGAQGQKQVIANCLRNRGYAVLR